MRFGSPNIRHADAGSRWTYPLLGRMNGPTNVDVELTEKVDVFAEALVIAFRKSELL